ncbi:hypothetical protein KC19_11G109500 [Ceratodon purpureus]|uniref:Transmembrane protein n=1 Tax=Ceratodon purpureus TaxID=3225 RepID=A0A8T0GF85_CERPU|nr:hypothetical protein KC19_11G109500 [Ceratodon purpureus]
MEVLASNNGSTSNGPQSAHAVTGPKVGQQEAPQTPLSELGVDTSTNSSGQLGQQEAPHTITLKVECPSEGSIVLDVEELQKALDAYREKKGQKSLSYFEQLETKELEAVKVQYQKFLSSKPTSSTPSSCCTFRSKKDEVPNQPKLPQCYEEIKNLLDIEKNPVYAKAQEEWSKKETLFTSRVERKKKRVANLKNEIYQLIGFFSVFQGVLLTAVSQSNLLHCNNLWSPVALSVVASVVTVAGVLQKLMQIRSLQSTIHSEEQSLKEVVKRLYKLRNYPGVHSFRFAHFEYSTVKEQSTRWNTFYLVLVIISLLSFSVLFPCSHWKILCYPGDNPK